MKALIEVVKAGGDLSEAAVREAAGKLLDESGDPDEKAGFLAALAEKGESPAEIAAFVKTFLEHAVRPELSATEVEGPMLDVCGTGGDKLNLFNVSTTSMFVLAAGGVVVVKHGNRGITSKSGGADVLEALGVPINHGPDEFVKSIKAHGAGFMLAPNYHPAFKAIAPVRAILAKQGQRTIFNMIGPLLNPVQPDFQLVGVFDGALTGTYVEILQSLGRKASWAVHGTTDDGRGMDEMSSIGSTKIAQLKGGVISSCEKAADSLGIAPATVSDLEGGDAQVNAKILEDILAGNDKGPKRDITVLNAAAGFVVTGKAANLGEGLGIARDLIDSGASLKKLRALQA